MIIIYKKIFYYAEIAPVVGECLKVTNREFIGTVLEDVMDISAITYLTKPVGKYPAGTLVKIDLKSEEVKYLNHSIQEWQSMTKKRPTFIVEKIRNIQKIMKRCWISPK